MRCGNSKDGRETHLPTLKFRVTYPERTLGQKPRGRAVVRNHRGQSRLIQCATSLLAGRIYEKRMHKYSVKAHLAVGTTPPALCPTNGALTRWPASGRRDRASGSLSSVGSSGYYWSFASGSRAYARSLGFGSSYVAPTNANNRANGLTVRPSRELNSVLSGFTISLLMKYSYKQIHTLVTAAYLDARQHERQTLAQLAFETRQEDGIAELSRKLYKREWQPLPMDWFVIDYPLIREVFCPKFTDRIVSHILFNLLAPIFERYFIFDSYSCRKGKGTGEGIERFEHHLRSVTDNYMHDAYVLNLDISGYFMSIVRQRLYEIIWDTLGGYRKKHPNEIDYGFTDYLIKHLVFRDPTKDCRFIGRPSLVPKVPVQKSIFGKKPGVGIPIGDVTNQLNSNIYLNVFDQYAKRELKIRNYCRYVDDIRIMHSDYDALLQIKGQCAEFLRDELQLILHPEKTSITSAYDTNYFLGAAIKPYRRYAKNDTVARFKSYIRNMESKDFSPHREIPRINSRLGYFKYFDERKMVAKTLESAPKVMAVFEFNKSKTKATIK